MSSAACGTSRVDPEVFFQKRPERGRSWARAAKEVCSVCPVVRSCLEAALRRQEAFGVWGGLTTWERHVYHGGPRPRYQRRTGSTRVANEMQQIPKNLHLTKSD
ncbi:WhiB family transcriptional regulator [Streptomyces sp. NPDC005574]|uniref:WhiB family transcriptional regulator n=1 Tax=Streptomyces sp. NPDC005574 TaxID=3156891 RepID=UPI0033AFA177